jgi:T5SS/PEP-CTERM-associated repeat protein
MATIYVPKSQQLFTVLLSPLGFPAFHLCSGQDKSGSTSSVSQYTSPTEGNFLLFYFASGLTIRRHSRCGQMEKNFMNKRYRIVWSEFRHAFIFTLENTVTQGKSSFTRKAVVQAVSAGLLALGGGQALAADLIFDSGPSAIATALTADNSLLVGVDNSSVSLTIGAGGSVTVNSGGNSATLGVNATSDGNSLNVTGSSAILSVAETLNVGNAGANNTLTVDPGGSVSALDIWIGGLAGSTANTVTVTGTGTLSATSSLILGYGDGTNSLNVQSGGQVTNTLDAVIGFVVGATDNLATVTGTGSLWTSTGVFYMGSASSGNRLTISNGGKVAVDILDALIGAKPGADNNQILVTGAVSELSSSSGTLYVGRSGNSNSLQIKSGGLVTSKNVRIGGGTGATGSPSGNGAIVDGAGSIWNIAGTLRVGAGVAGTNSGLDITNAGVVNVTGNSFVGYDATSDGNHVLISGAGSQLNANALTIGNAAGSINNVVTLANGGALSASAITIGDSSGLVIGAGGASGAISTPITITGARTAPFVKFNHTNSNYTFASLLAGSLEVIHDGSGTTNLTGTNTYTGATTINAGVLNINSISATSAITVNSGGTLGVAAGNTGTDTGIYTQDAAGTFRTYITNNTTFGILNVLGTVGMASNARIDVQVNNCGNVTPGTTFAGIISSNNTISVNSFIVTDNCAGLVFTASLSGNSRAVNLVANIAPAVSIPSLSEWGMFFLSSLLAFGAVISLRRQRQ